MTERAAILAIGDELTLGQSLDTNSHWLSTYLAERGIETVEHRTVADDRAAIAGAFRDLSAIASLVIATGGLGPTDDDLTREALGDAVAPGLDLLEDPDALAAIEARFRNRSRPMPAANRRQALHPDGTTMLANDMGTAPGIRAVLDGATIFVFPGPPRELKPMVERFVDVGNAVDAGLCTATVHAYGIGESDAAGRIADLTARDRDPLVGTTVSMGTVTARIRGRDEEAVRAAQADVRQRWAPFAYGVDDGSLAASLVALLAERGRRIAVAESCTGGALAARIVDVPGASDVMLGGVVAYANEVKVSALGVDADVLATHGAVSPQVAAAMAEGVRTRFGADVGISTTGIAGPGGAVPGKPVGTVDIGVALAPELGTSFTRRFRQPGDRSLVRSLSVLAGLQLARFALLGESLPLLWEVEP